MIRTITNTTFTLGIIAVINFVLVTLIFRNLGQSGTAEMGLIVLGISFIVMISNIIGGSALVFLTPRENNFTLLVISYGWAIFATLFMGFILHTFELVPMEFIWWTIILGLLECVLSIHNQLFIGNQDMKSHNGMKLLQKGSQIVIFVLLSVTIFNFVLSLFLSYLISLSFSFWVTYKKIDNFSILKLQPIFKKALRYGFQVQTSNILQLLNYRVLYYIIEKTMGSVLGLFIVAVQLSEALWIPSKSLAIVQYSKIANEKQKQKNTLLSLSFLKVSVIITAILLLILLAVPNSWFVFFFDSEIVGIKPILLSLSIGVLAISFSQSFAHYFSGVGRYSVLINAAFIGLSVLVISGWLFISQFGILGAGITTSLSYLASSLFLGIAFFRKSSLSVKSLIPSKTDLKQVLNQFSKKVE